MLPYYVRLTDRDGVEHEFAYVLDEAAGRAIISALRQANPDVYQAARVMHLRPAHGLWHAIYEESW